MNGSMVSNSDSAANFLINPIKALERSHFLRTYPKEFYSFRENLELE